MKDIHDSCTLDLWPVCHNYDVQVSTYLRQYNIDASRSSQIRAYLHEKPYLREALRRTVK